MAYTYYSTHQLSQSPPDLLQKASSCGLSPDKIVPRFSHAVIALTSDPAPDFVDAFARAASPDDTRGFFVSGPEADSQRHILIAFFSSAQHADEASHTLAQMPKNFETVHVVTIDIDEQKCLVLNAK